MVDLRVMQCMPLGPPRVGKTCLKKRLLDEGIPTSPSPSTPIVGEKQTVLVKSPDTLTLEAKGTNSWKPIPLGSELIDLIRIFKNAPQSFYHSVRSLNTKKSLNFFFCNIALLHLIFLFFKQQWVLATFFLASSMISGVELIHYIYKPMRYVVVGLCMFQLITYIASFWTMPVLAYPALVLAIYNVYILIRSHNPKWMQYILTSCLLILLFIPAIYIPFHYAFSNDPLETQFTFLSVHCLLFPNNRILQNLLPANMRHELFLVVLHLFRTLPLLFYFSHYSLMVILLEILKFFAVLIGFYQQYNLLPMQNIIWACFILCSMACTDQSSIMILSDFITLTIIFITFVSRFGKKRVVNADDYDKTSSFLQTTLKNIPDIPSSEDYSDSDLKIYFTDAGGQPEFQEVLPALLSGPTVFFIVFNLAQGFSANYKVEYVDSNYPNLKPYKTQFTVMDALLQCLASISCLGEFSKTSSRANIGIKPKVFFVGTHKDLVSPAVITNMEKELRNAVKNTAWYKNEMIQFASPENLIFSVDNFDKSDSSFGMVRQAIQKLSKTKEYNFKIPAPWLGLELTLRAHADNVMSISECKNIAKKCCINKEKELNNALWFLHNRIGSIRHYQQVDGLNNVVITKPQVLSTIVTDLLISTFPLATGKVNATFREKGWFTREELQNIGKIHQTGLSVTQVIALLCYLHILAPLKMDERGNRDYFLPCALSHAPKPDKYRLQSKRGQVFSPVLLIGFKCGYTPKGVFSALVSYMLQHTDNCGNEWFLDEECIFRDQATFLIGTTGFSLTITYLPKILNLKFRSPEVENTINLPKDVHPLNILTSLSKGLDIVCQRLNYTCKTEPLFGFYCTCTNCSNEEPHPAFKRNENILACEKHASNTYEMNQDQKKWFPSSSTSKLQTVIQKLCYVINFLYHHKYKKRLLLLLTLGILFCLATMNFNIHELTSEHSDVRNVQIEYYNSHCDLHNSAHGKLSCKLLGELKKSNQSQLRPIRLWLNTEEHDEVDDKISKCALTISFDDCYPKDCRNPMSVVRNAFFKFLQSCPLSNNVTWPVVHHLVGFDQVINVLVSFLPKVVGIHLENFQFYKINSFLYYYYFFHYNIVGDSSTKNLISAIEERKLSSFRELLIIMKFTLYTQPNLTPIIILKSVEHAVNPINGTMPIQELLTDISEEVSSINWLIPIIATSEDKTWIRPTKESSKDNSKQLEQLHDTFPVYMELN